MGVISGDDCGMGYLLSMNDKLQYHLVVMTRKLLTKLWARSKYILSNRNDGVLTKKAVEDIKLTYRLVLYEHLFGVNNFNRE